MCLNWAWGEFVGAGSVLEQLLGGDLRVDDAAGGDKAVEFPPSIEAPFLARRPA